VPDLDARIDTINTRETMSRRDGSAYQNMSSINYGRMGRGSVVFGGGNGACAMWSAMFCSRGVPCFSRVGCHVLSRISLKPIFGNAMCFLSGFQIPFSHRGRLCVT